MSRRRTSRSRQARATGSSEAHERLAIEALAFLAAEPERLDRFLAITGIEPARIREAAREPMFLAGVLEHIASDESLLVAFAECAGADPVAVARASRDLAGGAWERDVP